MYLKNGDLSAYALSCGYLQQTRRETESGGTVIFQLSSNGSSYDIDIYYDGVTRKFIGGVITGWAQFDTLTAARKFLKRALRYETVGEAWAACLTVMA